MQWKATKELTQLKAQEAVKPLETKIENDKPLVEFAEQVRVAKDVTWIEQIFR
ncbi:hypothetical protein psyc5s11_29210 [Clostridium gelidum]|uniref:Uncharacterized protein n=1 Tax=Clostridium gelidum TaxID=704125 RepID=A0ABM7TD16_9CLOT|nr:hypothetical protein [Clostridium gelidum]BCZ46854.1 hypothetical protein psyc5s11_29210 [Clostridium gelidum]